MSAIQEGFKIDRRRWGVVQREVGSLPLPSAEEVSGTGEVARYLSVIENYLASNEESMEVESLESGDLELMWLDDVYSLVNRGKPDDAIDLLFEHVDAFLSSDQYNPCNELLRTIDVGRLDANLLVAALSVTKRGAAELPERKEFAKRVRTRLSELAPERAERLMRTLE